MKRFFQLMIVAIVALTACCACSKVNDIDKRLGVLENIVSDLKAQISAGAVITSVDKTSDGCTFTLSNGQSYTVTNGKNGTDGEAIIADVKIEENFVVLTLKNGETLRISYQNPLSIATLTIVPDYTDGTVKSYNKQTNCMFLSIEVTPSKYAGVLADTSRFIHKVVFSPVKKTKADFGDAFTITPSSILYYQGAPIPYIELYLELDEMSAWMLDNGTYAVSCTIEDRDGIHGASTSFAPIYFKSEPDPGGGEDPGVTEATTTYKVELGIEDFLSVSDQIASGARTLDFGDAKIKGGTFGLTDDGELILKGTITFSVLARKNYIPTYSVNMICTELEREPDSNEAYYTYDPVSKTLHSSCDMFVNVSAVVSKITLLASTNGNVVIRE